MESIIVKTGFSGSSAVKESACDAGDPCLIPGLGRSPREALGYPLQYFLGFPGGSDGEEPPCNAEDLRSVPGLGRSPGEGSGNPLQYSCLESSMDGGAWWATVHGMSLHFGFPDVASW